MATNEERLRAADLMLKIPTYEMVGKIEDGKIKHFGFLRLDVLAMALGCDRQSDVMRTLHDLIEPEPERTCRIEQINEVEMRCSACGYIYDWQ